MIQDFNHLRTFYGIRDAVRRLQTFCSENWIFFIHKCITCQSTKSISAPRATFDWAFWSTDKVRFSPTQLALPKYKTPRLYEQTCQTVFTMTCGNWEDEFLLFLLAEIHTIIYCFLQWGNRKTSAFEVRPSVAKQLLGNLWKCPSGKDLSLHPPHTSGHY